MFSYSVSSTHRPAFVWIFLSSSASESDEVEELVPASDEDTMAPLYYPDWIETYSLDLS